jgi:hypothetical protein
MLSSRWISMVLAIGLAVSFGIASIGVLPSAEQVAKWLDLAAGEQFPCASGRCGCSTARECWTNCCCHSPAQRLDWALRRGVMPPSYAKYADAEWIAAANRIAPGSATCGACVARIQADLREGLALAATRCEMSVSEACCGKAEAPACQLAGGCTARPEAPAAPTSCCATRREASTALPCLSPLGCKGKSPLIAFAIPPAISTPCFSGLMLEWSRLDVVVLDDLRAHSRALDVSAPPPRRVVTAR